MAFSVNILTFLICSKDTCFERGDTPVREEVLRPGDLLGAGLVGGARPPHSPPTPQRPECLGRAGGVRDEGGLLTGDPPSRGGPDLLLPQGTLAEVERGGEAVMGEMRGAIMVLDDALDADSHLVQVTLDEVLLVAALLLLAAEEEEEEEVLVWFLSFPSVPPTAFSYLTCVIVNSSEIFFTWRRTAVEGRMLLLALSSFLYSLAVFFHPLLLLLLLLLALEVLGSGSRDGVSRPRAPPSPPALRLRKSIGGRISMLLKGILVCLSIGVRCAPCGISSIFMARPGMATFILCYYWIVIQDKFSRRSSPAIPPPRSSTCHTAGRPRAPRRQAHSLMDVLGTNITQEAKTEAVFTSVHLSVYLTSSPCWSLKAPRWFSLLHPPPRRGDLIFGPLGISGVHSLVIRGTWRLRTFPCWSLKAPRGSSFPDLPPPRCLVDLRVL